jgi:hypothetical protein
MREHARDQVSGPVTLDYFQSRLAEGWRVAAIEWEREAEQAAGTSSPEQSPEPARSERAEEIPYGFRIASDCRHLERNPDEMAVLMAILQEIIKDRPFSQIAEELNRQHLVTRRGRPWTSACVFDLLPRLIEAGPQLLKSEQWPARRLEVLKSGAR